MSDETAQDPVVVARALDAEALEGEALLLSALGIPFDLRPDGDAIELVVLAVWAERARTELSRMGQDRQDPVVQPALLGGRRAAIPAALGLVAFHAWLVSLPSARRDALYRAGDLDGVKVRAGELWRTSTALTLHADGAHVVGNALATMIFVGAAGDWVGPGVALLCTVLAGILGNAASVLVDPHHHAIGFSTATFGALGLTAVFGFVARYRSRLERQRAWLALAAGLGLLVLLGAGERSDLLAHIFGLVAGALIGFVVTRARPLRAQEPVQVGDAGQWLAAVIAVVLLVGAWLPAVR
ncbi:MAG: rhomboid family intramembrane serine protease [Polyangia bacterium]